MATQLAQIVFPTAYPADGFFPTPVAGWVKPITDTTRILSGYFTRSGSTPAVFKYNTPFSTSEIEVAVRLPPSLPVTSLGLTGYGGGEFIDSSGNGYALLYAVSGLNFIVRAHLVVNYLYTTQLFTNTITQSGNLGKTIKLQRHRVTGLMKVFLDAGQLGADFTSLTYDPTYGAVTANDSVSGVHTITLTDIASYQVDSFNGSNSIERGQQNVAYSTTGFSSVTAITTNTAGVTVGGINDTTGDGDCDVSDYAEAGLYPVLPASVIYTFGDGTNTAQITKTLTIKSTESAVITAGLIAVNDSYLGKHFQDAGLSIADGGQIVSPTIAGLTIGADGSYNYTGVVPLELSLWYITPDTGRSYEFDFTFGGGSGSDTGLTAVGLTTTGLTMTGLTMVGL